MKKLSRAEKIRRYITANPSIAIKDVAKKFDTTYQVVYMVKSKMLLPPVTHITPERMAELIHQHTRPKRRMQSATPSVDVSTEEANRIRKDVLAQHITDPINSPAHYKVGGIETIDFIDAKEFGYNLGNVIKYISRADHKGYHYEDLLKARWYLNREIAKFSTQPEVTK